MQYSEFRWIHLLTFLTFRATYADEVPKCFQLCNKLYVQFGEKIYMLVTNVFCKTSVSKARVVTNTRVGNILFSL